MFEKDVERSAFERVSKFYLLDQDLLEAEHQIFCHFKSSVAAQCTSSPELFKLLWKNDVLPMMPEMSKVVHIYSAIPATSCSAERLFSALRRLKTYLRSTMSQTRLSSLALMHIEREFVNTVLSEDIEEIIDTFGGRSGRQSSFF